MRIDLPEAFFHKMNDYSQVVGIATMDESEYKDKLEVRDAKDVDW